MPVPAKRIATGSNTKVGARIAAAPALDLARSPDRLLRSPSGQILLIGEGHQPDLVTIRACIEQFGVSSAVSRRRRTFGIFGRRPAEILQAG